MKDKSWRMVQVFVPTANQKRRAEALGISAEELQEQLALEDAGLICVGGVDRFLDQREKEQSDPYGLKELEEQEIEKFTKRGLTAEQVRRAMSIDGVNLEFLQVVYDNHRKGLPHSVGVDVFLDRMENRDDDDDDEEQEAEEEPAPVVKTQTGKLSSPDSKSGRVQRACLELLRQHESDGSIPTNGRFIFYEVIQRGVLPKAYLDEHGKKKPRQPAADVTEALTALRKLQLIPWNWILDETREIAEWQFAKSVAAYVKQAAARARIDAWAGKPAPLIICESRATKGVLERVGAEYLVPVTATNGQCGGFLHTDVIPMLEDGERPVGYIGDFEIRGPADQIEGNTRAVIEQETGRIFTEETWTRIALTKEQVDADPWLLSLVIDKVDRRYKPAKPYKAVECEVIGQNVLEQLLREYLDDRLPEPLASVLEREERERANVVAMLSENL